MALQSNLETRTATAGADLSAHQFKLVTLNSSNEVVLTAAITDVPFGILQNKPGDGEAATVAVRGRSKFISQGATVTGEVLAAGTTDGALDQAASTTYPVGICREGAADGKIGSVDLHISLTPRA